MAKGGANKDFAKLRKELEELEKLQVRIGFQRGAALDDDGVDMVDIAMWNELGTERNGKPHIPSRPFLRQSVDNNADKIKAFIKKELDGIGQTKTAKQVLQKLGLRQKSLVQETINNGDFTKNKPATVARKKSAQPLVDSGQMLASVNFVIEEKGADSD